MTTLQAYIQKRKKEKVKMRAVNYPLQIVRRILNLFAEEWKDEYSLSWLPSAPKIKLESETDKHKPYPLSPEEQIKLFDELPIHLRRMAIFAANTGC
ncbi:hypothetical protein [Rickettsiella massiliensis]|uniref:hypothetical protein n=1 Tax=Rickettsiella massiliensis TaxID=676517 RepID=UPI00029A15A8|nr:hypothetical protein [Rickettsiella massiliensis]